jgi:hypothetical protein
MHEVSLRMAMSKNRNPIAPASPRPEPSRRSPHRSLATLADDKAARQAEHERINEEQKLKQQRREREEERQDRINEFFATKTPEEKSILVEETLEDDTDAQVKIMEAGLNPIAKLIKQECLERHVAKLLRLEDVS